MRPARDHVYDAWVERNTYTTTLLYSAFIAVLLPVFYYVLHVAAPHATDSLPLRLVCTVFSGGVAAGLLLVPSLRRYGEMLQFAQVVLVMLVIDMLVVNSGDQYMYIASALLVIIGAQNAFFRVTTLAVAMSFGCLAFVAYSAVDGILLQPYSLTTIAIFVTAYVLAYIPAYLHIRARQSDVRSRMEAMRATSELEEAHAITHLGKWSQNLVTGEVQCSAEIMRILGLPLDTPHREMPDIYMRSVHPEEREVVEAAFATCDTVGHFSIDHRIVLPGDDIRWVQLSGKQQIDATGAVVHRIGTLMDITARKEAEVSLERLARYDPLTGLPNRSVLQEQLREAVEARTRGGGRLAVMFFDLDRFKDINDSLGHSVGDLLLKAVSERIRSLLPAATLIARWGGDEFVALLDDVESVEAVERTCKRVINGLATPFEIDSYEFAVMASIGVALFPRDGVDPEVLIRNADTAMYAAKDAPAQRFAFFASEMHAIASRRHHIQNQLQSAIASGSLTLYYQPIVDAKSGAIGGAEALLRWTDVDGRMHRPSDFISIAEDTGAIVQIGAWVIEQAARQAVAWRDARTPIVVAVNISPRQLAHPDFSETLAHTLRATGVDPSLLEVEITESGLVPNAAAVMRVLETIRAMGVGIAVDDFGTGYSAFSYLKQLPLTSLKIDSSFVDEIERDVDRAIAESIIAIAHKLGLSVTAEGVETGSQRRILEDLGCDRLQGFEICEPLALEQFEQFTRRRLAVR